MLSNFVPRPAKILLVIFVSRKFSKMLHEFFDGHIGQRKGKFCFDMAPATLRRGGAVYHRKDRVHRETQRDSKDLVF